MTLCTNNLTQFRDRLYQNFANRANTLMELLDALCSVPDAGSVVEYSLAACFRRSYSTIFKAINEMESGEKWWQLAHIAYAQLWMARHIAHPLPRPWQRNLPLIKRRLISPTWVQRDFARMIRQLGTPAQPPKLRGISPGRRPGAVLPKRPRHKGVVKSQITAHST